MAIIVPAPRSTATQRWLSSATLFAEAAVGAAEDAALAVQGDQRRDWIGFSNVRFGNVMRVLPGPVAERQVRQLGLAALYRTPGSRAADGRRG